MARVLYYNRTKMKKLILFCRLFCLNKGTDVLITVQYDLVYVNKITITRNNKWHGVLRGFVCSNTKAKNINRDNSSHIEYDDVLSFIKI